MSSLSRQWRSLEQLADDPAFVARAAQEFPSLAGALAAPRDRRGVLKLMAAGLALAGLGGCDHGPPDGVLVPPVRPAANAVSNGTNLFATGSLLHGYAAGVLVRHDVGRPIKVEGNPLHPASLGATDPFAQADLLGFYDPDRSAGIEHDGVPQDWQSLQTALAGQRMKWAQSHGDGLRVLTGSVTSPTLARQLKDLKQRYPGMQWHQWEPVSRDAVRAGAGLAYGRPVEIVPHLDAADIILAIDSDLLDSAPGHVRFAHDFAARRNPARDTPLGPMSRVYAVEPTPGLIGVAADHRAIASPSEIGRLVPLLADMVLRDASAPADGPKWLAQAAADLKAHRGHALVHVGPHQPAELHALAYAMNDALGGRGTTFEVIEPVETAPVDQAASLRDLLSDMRAGRVQSLIMIGGNPVYSASGMGFEDALRRVEFSLATAIGPSETAQAAHWSLPQRHPFEDWSDARAYDGTATILQPQAQPLYEGVSPHHLLAMMQDFSAPASREIVRQTWNADGGEQKWHDSLARGVVADTASARADVTLRPDAGRASPKLPPARPVTLLLRPDPHLWDGRFANNAWLQELPRPLTKLTWDNPLLISPAEGRRLSVGNGDRVTIAAGQQHVTLPAWIMPGQADDCVVGLLGFGRRVAGTVGEGTGFDLYPLANQDGEVILRKAEGREILASTEHHDPMLAEPEDFARHGTLAQFQGDPRFLAKEEDHPEIYRWKPPGPAQWGMSIDLNSCIGCNACVVACMAENNIPVVGKQEVIREREMHWLRIDRYYEGEADNPDILFQPVLCMHCEQAPCEYVCPVGATVHDDEGLNVMVYNRCIGTRFCSNNCPYKVRRFNFFDFTGSEHRPAQARNPEVTVRGRGVMEKCTFCLQRIAAARVVADIENRPIGAEEVRTACQAACPAQAISFGNMAEGGTVVERKRSPLAYALLSDQNTHPRVTYEARVTNPKPDEGEGT
jgi:MoCo/4Fe-4S cofactor protein with predicted Tat translocation signal